MQVFNTELWGIGFALDVVIGQRETLQNRGVKTVAVISDPQATICRLAHLETSLGQPIVRRINTRAQSLLAHAITTEIHWVLGHSGIPENEEADRKVNLARDASGKTVIQRQNTSASNRARPILKGKSAAKTEWEADKCRNHFSYRLKGMAGTNRDSTMSRVMPLAARVYCVMSGHAPTGVHLKLVGHRDDHKCWWCGGTVPQTRQHLFRHCCRLRVHQRKLWKAVRKVTGWRAGRCWYVQISELVSIEVCDQAVMDFLAASEGRKFPPN
jgi:hypothetical protein